MPMYNEAWQLSMAIMNADMPDKLPKSVVVSLPDDSYVSTRTLMGTINADLQRIGASFRLTDCEKDDMYPWCLTLTFDYPDLVDLADL